MKTAHFASALVLACAFVIAAGAKNTVVINDPTAEAPKVTLTAAEQGLFEKAIIPVAKEHLSSDVCEELTPEVTGRTTGAFTRAGAEQTLLFYQFCQTGNGLGNVGVAIVEKGKVVAHFVSEEAGWSDRAAAIADMNQNGVDEIALYYSGGMHQGAGGTGVDIMEVAGGKLKGIGWFQAEEFTETSPVMGYKIVARVGKPTTYTREKYTQNSAGKWRKAGAPVPMKLKPAVVVFETVK
jgi:hypothetical protein